MTSPDDDPGRLQWLGTKTFRPLVSTPAVWDARSADATRRRCGCAAALVRTARGTRCGDSCGRTSRGGALACVASELTAFA
jgi:hypothetical protein